MIPTVAELLPELDAFVDDLGAEYGAGHLPGWTELEARCRPFYDEGRMAAITSVVPAWSKMASYRDGVTLWHTTAALMSMRDLAEYRTASADRRVLMDWTVLLHDVAKEPAPGSKDMRHAFRSAAAAGATLPAAGFRVTERYADDFPEWQRLTEGAFRMQESDGEPVQDNRRLPEIIGGADRLFGAEAALVVKAIALHTAITAVADWPAYAPLTPPEERRYVTPELHPVLLVMMLADHGGWNLFEPDTLAAYYAETRAVFARL